MGLLFRVLVFLGVRGRWKSDYRLLLVMLFGELRGIKLGKNLVFVAVWGCGESRVFDVTGFRLCAASCIKCHRRDMKRRVMSGFNQ